jgi:hypothetical protein
MNDKNRYTHKIWIAFSVLLLAFSVNSCNKLVEAPIPSESMADENVYNIDATAIAVLDGIYISMNANAQPFQGNQSIMLLSGLSADELTLYSGLTGSANFYNSYYTNSLAQALGGTFAGAENWSLLYSYVFRCNAAIEGLQASTGLSTAIKQQLLGEATFLRAIYYFYLVNLFGDVPLALTTDPEVNIHLLRSSKADVYLQIITDLQDAEEKLNASYLNGQLLISTTERVRPTKWAAKALLARVYLYTGDWANAETKATDVINNTALFSLLPLNSVFLKNSKEAIWQLQPTDINFNTLEAQTLVIPPTGPDGNICPAYLSIKMLASFEADDQRAVYGNWVNMTIYDVSATSTDTVLYANKYKLYELDATITSETGTTNMQEYFMMLRLGEQYLVRAEARTQQANISGAQADVNAIRSRSFLTPKPIAVTDKTGLLAAILHERQVELFCEGGHRWLDLKRTGKIDEVMKGITPLKSNGVTMWQSYQALYPLPYNDLYVSLIPNPSLVQNDGYK